MEFDQFLIRVHRDRNFDDEDDTRVYSRSHIFDIPLHLESQECVENSGGQTLNFVALRS
jgi:hypothetical protein